MWQDFRFAARLLAKSPLFTVAVVLLLTVGIGANTVIFSLVDALLLRPLPVRDPERLVRLVTVRAPLGVRSAFLYEDYEAWKKQITAFQDLFAWSEHDMFVSSGDSTERARVHFVTGNFFAALGTSPAAGRLLTPDDQQLAAGTAPVVLGYPYWQRRFGGRSGVLGQTITVDGHKVLVVGVTPKTFNGITVETSPDLRAPVGWLRSLRPNLYENRIECEVAGRLRAGASLEAVRQEAEAVWKSHWAEWNPTDPGLPGRFDLEPAARGVSRMRGQFAGVLWLLMGGVALLMLMVCANVAGLLMARTAGREGEIAVRMAIGATRFRLVRQLFAEALLLMMAGAAGAVAFSFVGIPFVAASLPPVRDFTASRLTLSLNLTPDWRVLAFAITVSALTVLVFGLVPALAATGRELHPLLKEARAGGGWRGRQALVAVQVSLCTMLLVGGGLTVLTLRRLEGMNPGFARDRIVTFSLDPDMAAYKPEQTAQLRRRLTEGARALPDVEAVALSARGLMRGTGIKMTVARAGERAGEPEFLNTSVHSVSPEYFETMRVPWLAGRNFTGREDPAATPKPVIVNEAFVRRFSGGRDILGQKFGSVRVNQEPAKAAFAVIGVVGDTKYRSMREPFQPIIYQVPDPGAGFIVHLRTRSSPRTVIAPMRRLLASLDPRLSYIEVTTLHEEVMASLWAERVAAFLATAFSIAAGSIAAAGLYALVAYAVMQRSREIGIRLALGALPRDVVRLIFARAAWLSVGGIAFGLAVAWALAPRIGPVLYQVNPRDLTVLGAAAAFAFLVTVVAALIPSLRAARLQPWSVLRQD